MKRVFLLVLDSLGIGEMPDAKAFGDSECNTLRRIAGSQNFRIPNLLKLGIGHLDGIDFLPKDSVLSARVARMCERSAGKDTTIGHWEIAGLISSSPLPTYPEGFPAEVLDEFSRLVGRGVLCNKPYSGTKVIEDYGQKHLDTGKLIVYTSADSVFQIAAHESVVPVEKLYEYCKIARSILQGKHAVGRVIARPFIGKNGAFVRTARRRDFSLEPYGQTLLDILKQADKSVISVGKIYDIFAARSIDEYYLTHSNDEGMRQTESLLSKDFEGLCFVNFVDFDMLYGHRQDVDGYALALSQFDEWLGNFINRLAEDDLLIITADHGCDPGDNSVDHTREYTPCICYGKRIEPKNLGTRDTFADISATVLDYLCIQNNLNGESLL